MVTKQLIVTPNIWTLLCSSKSIFANQAFVQVSQQFCEVISAFLLLQMGQQFTHVGNRAQSKIQDARSSWSQIPWKKALCGSVQAKQRKDGSCRPIQMWSLSQEFCEASCQPPHRDVNMRQHREGRARPWDFERPEFGSKLCYLFVLWSCVSYGTLWSSVSSSIK